MAGIDLNPSEVELVWSKCDHNADGEISYEEFVDALARDTVAPAAMGKRGMQALEAMGVSAYLTAEEELGYERAGQHYTYQ